MVPIAVVLMLAGCASVQTQRAKDLSADAVRYTTATEALVDAATDAMIDADSEAFVRTPPKQLKGEVLRESNELLLGNIKKFQELRASVMKLEAYFKALQSLVDNPTSEATASAVSSIAGQVNALNKAINQTSGDIINSGQQQALSALSKAVADQVHGAMVANALRRDAPIIGEALLHQEQVLAFAGTVVLGALRDDNARYYSDKVDAPFQKQQIDASWVASRRQYLKTKAMGESSQALITAKSAANQMGKSWEKILSGNYDIS